MTKLRIPRKNVSDVVDQAKTLDNNEQGDRFAQLEEKNRILQEQINKLLSMIANGQTNKKEASASDNLPEVQDQFDTVNISPDDYIKVVSLCDMTLNLSTLGFGRGKQFVFKKFGESKRIVYSELVSIMENSQHFLEDGYYFIADPKVVHRHGLEDIYKNILSKEKIQKILDCNDDTSVQLFASANEKQKELIISMLADKVSKDSGSVDLNIIDRISRIAKIDIAKRAEDIRTLLEIKS